MTALPWVIAAVTVIVTSGCHGRAAELPPAKSQPSIASCSEHDQTSVPAGSVEWLRANARAVRLPPFEDDDFSDLQGLDHIVGDATIVGLGEQTHGDGTAFRMKARIVRYLHERLGFDVLAFETSLIDCEAAATRLASETSTDMATVRQCVANEWGRAAQLQTFVSYLATESHSPRPLTITGFDILPRKMTVDVLRSSFRDAGFAEAEDAALWGSIRTAFLAARDGNLEQLPALRDSARASVRRLRAALDRRGAFSASEVLRRNLGAVDTSLTWWINDVLAESKLDGGDLSSVNGNQRDQALADNVLWLSDKKYAGKKMILWAASFHLLKGHETIETKPLSLDYRGMRTMGEILGSRLVSIACIADEGNFSNHGRGSEALDAHPADAIESMLSRAGFDNAILDLRTRSSGADWPQRSFVAGPLGYAYMRARWADSFDAFVFTRRMEPSTLIVEDAGSPSGRAAK